ncbi:hypothetical protein MOF52_05885 [Bacillus inaquosorum]|uniref:hypothetical protein n=1 Tax=Bacillus inaquosorum TaxID=483913 RepID=UPI002280AE9C|nr:hypothetical protein [Bacillus inaquosorum]MCY9407573.1 hypothetical protein [Bacillus inaquosorum]MCY9418846.1 hypothetical protein [Bacillus inaquosorum]
MKKIEFRLIDNESPERNQVNPFQWNHSDRVTVSSESIEHAIKVDFLNKFKEELNDLHDYDINGKNGEVTYENSHDGSYLIFKVSVK